MQETIFISLPLPQLQTLIVDCVNACLDANKPNTPTEPADRWFNVNELCSYLPDHPAKQTIYGKVSNNEIPYYKDKKTLRFLKSEIDRWLMKGKVKTTLEVQEDIKASTDAFLSKRKGGKNGK